MSNAFVSSLKETKMLWSIC